MKAARSWSASWIARRSSWAWTRRSKSRPPPVVAPETEEQRARAREALRLWTKFAVDPKDFQGKDLSMITLERLKEVLSDDPNSGEFTWKDIPSLQEHETV